VHLLPIALTAALAVMMVGCGSTPPPSKRHNVPPDRILAEDLLRPSTDRTCSVTVTRDYDFGGSAQSITAFIDGKPFARLGTSDTVTIYATPGRHLVGARFRRTIGEVSPVEREFFLTASKPTSVHITVINGAVEFQPSSELLF
jgi:hypothetical protein